MDMLASIPEDEQAVLFVGEAHNEGTLEEMLTLIDAYKPDAIGIEMRPTQETIDSVDLARTLCLTFPRKSLTPDDFSHVGGKSTPMDIGYLYALWKKVPLYFMDWHPCAPESIADVSMLDTDIYSYAELSKHLEHTITTIFGIEFPDELPHENDGKKLWNLFQISPHGMALRNEWTAMAIDARPEKRILYIGGYEHFYPQPVYTIAGPCEGAAQVHH